MPDEAVVFGVLDGGEPFGQPALVEQELVASTDVVCGFDLIRGFVPASGRMPAWMNGHRLIFEVSKLEGDQNDDRTRQSAPARPHRGESRLGAPPLAGESPDL
ncbi:hypothetical protein, partial [Streptomyces minutiscleroticus]|uniref:hypothetical protein n=1 Tax=Streptomyces minutiscleroticus TaxID=68238 RepID=UPI0033225DB1